MTTLTVPNGPNTNRRPLSNHGMPKPPRVTSPGEPHRFSRRSSSPHGSNTGYLSPRTPGLMSPPMSARSFGTFIDSEPSTPAYSPRMEYDWDSSTPVRLRPMSSCSEPGSPTEPVWEMMKPIENAPRAQVPLSTSRKEPSVIMTTMTSTPRLAAPPTKREKPSSKPKLSIQSEVAQPLRKDYTEEAQAPAEQPTGISTAPLGKLASKMKLMLRRKSTTDSKKKKEKKEKEKDYYSPVEEVHWTEM
jgi:hypothetical protein